MIYPLSLHDALPICRGRPEHDRPAGHRADHRPQIKDPVLLTARQLTASLWTGPALDGGTSAGPHPGAGDRKSTRLNSSHANISYAVFCLNKKIVDR